MTAAALVWAALPGVARAASGSTRDDNPSELSTVVLLVVVIGVAYVLAHNVVERLQRRFLVVSGAEYLLLGFLLGPAFPAIHALDNVSGLLPVIALAAGWVGLLRGTDFDFASLQRLDPATWRVVFLHHLLPGVAVGVGSYYFFTETGWLFASSHDAALSAAALA
ncbi:MAG: hypothetical protein E4H00_00540 [Myxococcales bacterium]|nr:MAG: hypothetical protein E4H00_00540 [Myxococcales bacterium]